MNKTYKPNCLYQDKGSTYKFKR